MIDFLRTIKPVPKPKRKYVWIYKPSNNIVKLVSNALSNSALTSKQLSARTGYDVTTVVRAVNWLIKNGCITKQRSGSDGRVFIYSLGE